VKDAQALLDKIEGTWVGSFKIRADLPRSNKVGVRQKLVRNTMVVATTGLQINMRVSKGVVLSRKLWGLEVGVGKQRRDRRHHPINKSCLLRDQIWLVMTLREVSMAESIQMKIAMEGFQDIIAILLRFDKILISTCKEEVF
jgi:hypothetical protein